MMNSFRVYFGIFIWFSIFMGIFTAYQALPSKKIAKHLEKTSHILSYLKEDYFPIQIYFPQSYLFQVKKGYEKTLDKNKISLAFQKEFHLRNIPLSSNSIIEVQKKNVQWLIKDEARGWHFVVRKNPNGCKIYQDVYILPEDSLNIWNGKNYKIIGRVRGKIAHPEFCAVQVEVFPDQLHFFGKNTHFQYMQDTGSFAEIVENLLSGENGKTVKKEFIQVFNKKKEWLLDTLAPVFGDVIETSMPHLKKGLTEAITNKSEALTALVQKELFEKKLMPILQKEIWPIVEKKAPPVLEPIAKKLWSQLPLAGIVSREMLYKIYLSKKSGIDRWNEYVQKKVLPILNQNQDKLIELVRNIAEEVASKDSVIKAFQDGSEEVFSHQKFKKIIQEILMEGIVKNIALRKAFLEKWDDLQDAISKITDELEGPIRKIADYILTKDGDYQKGINPNLARVLRQQILWKDTQWIQVYPGKTPSPIRKNMYFKGKVN